MARDVPLSPALLARHFEKIAFGEEFRLENGLTVPVPLAPDGVLRKWTVPVRYTFTDIATARDRVIVADLGQKLAARTGLAMMRAGTGPANLYVRILTAGDRAEIARQFSAEGNTSPMAELFLAWASAPDWPCAGEIYFKGPEDARRYEIALGMIYVRDEVRGLSRQACLEEEVTQAMGLTRDDRSVRPSIFNDDEEYALLTHHDELLLQMLYDPALTPGMNRKDAMVMVADIAERVLAP